MVFLQINLTKMSVVIFDNESIFCKIKSYFYSLYTYFDIKDELLKILGSMIGKFEKFLKFYWLHQTKYDLLNCTHMYTRNIIGLYAFNILYLTIFIGK